MVEAHDRTMRHRAQSVQPRWGQRRGRWKGFLFSPMVLLLAFSLAVPGRAVPGSSAAPTQAAPYRLGAGDRLQITLFQVPQYSGEADVLVDGTVNLPLAGTVSVAGLTLEQAATTISAAYAPYLRRPLATVSLLLRRPLQIGVAGEVAHPGAYTIDLETGSPPTLTQLLGEAGGVTQSADLRQIQVRRRSTESPSGTEEALTIDLWQLVQTGDLQYDIDLRDGDQVFVPTTATVNLVEAPLLAASNLAADPTQPINVAVVGEVFRPGTYTVAGGIVETREAGETGGLDRAESVPTVTRAIQLAGGIKPLADVRQVEIRRLTRSGDEQVFTVDLWALLQGDLRQDASLQAGDTIYIPTATALSPEEATAIAAASFSPDSIQVNVVGEVATPGLVEISPNSPLNQAILAAGGFNRRANRRSVDLIRLNPDGTVARQEIEVDLAAGIDAAGNPVLQNNDVIIVRRSGLASTSDTLELVLRPLGSVLSLFEFPFRFLNLFD